MATARELDRAAELAYEAYVEGTYGSVDMTAWRRVASAVLGMPRAALNRKAECPVCGPKMNRAMRKIEKELEK